MEMKNQPFRNYYVHCRQQWSDEWDCMCNDRCPICDHEIEPYLSLDMPNGETVLHVDSRFAPENGWPPGVTDLSDLDGYSPD